MAKLLLSCDDNIYCVDGKYYAENNECYNFYKRYLRIFDKLKLVTRCKYVNKVHPNFILLDKEIIEFVPIPNFNGPYLYLLNYFKVGKAINEIINDYDAAILRIPSTTALRISNRLITNQTPFGVEVVFDAFDGFKNSRSYIEKLLWFIIYHKVKRVCKLANGVSCVTENYLQKRYYSKVINSFTSRYSSLSLDNSFYTGYKSFPKSSKFVIAHVANQITYKGRKGQYELITAISKMQYNGFDIKVRFAGQNMQNSIEKLEKYALQKGVYDKIEFVGFLNREQLSIFLEKADLFVLPTYAEGLPRVIIEAMAKGLPCITTDVSGNSELINAQFLIKSHNDIDGLLKCIKELISDKNLYEATSEINYRNSLKYRADILENRRDLFYSNLKNCIK